MRTVLWGSIVLVAAAGGMARADVPAFCKADGVEKERTSSDVKSALDQADPYNALPAIIGTMCWPDREAQERQKEVEKSRQAWSKKLDMSEADWVDAAQWASEMASMRQGHDIRVDYDKKYAWSTLGPIDQFAGIQNGFPNNGSGNSVSDYTYLADALGTKLTETGRLAYIMKACIGYDTKPAEWAMCEPDIALLDRKKIATELRGDKRSGSDKMKIRIHLFHLDGKLKTHAAEVKAIKDKEDAYPKLFEIAAATRKEWDTLWKTETALLDVALAMDDARQTRSRKAFEGCSEKTWPLWTAQVAKFPAKRFEGFSTDIADSWMAPAMAIVVSTPQGYLASHALVTCHLNDKANDNEPVISSLGSVMTYTPGLRGPRLASLWAMRNAGLELDDQSAKIEFPDIRHDTSSRYRGSAARGYFATVAKVSKPDGKGMVQVSFAKKLEKQEQCAKSKYTNRISQITSNGTVIYESVCLKYSTVVVDRSPDTQTVHARYVKGLKPGMNVYIGSGAVMAAWVKGKKSPALVAGVAVK